MGYSHYWRPKKEPTDQQWQNILDGFKKLQALALISRDVPIQLEFDDSSPPQKDEYCISFNGVGDYGHETFYLARVSTGFNCCKTARKPYDLMVMAVLLLMHRYAPRAWDISSDGGERDWLPALALVNSLGIGECFLPYSLN
jgi:hypothetical protein